MDENSQAKRLKSCQPLTATEAKEYQRGDSHVHKMLKASIGEIVTLVWYDSKDKYQSEVGHLRPAGRGCFAVETCENNVIIRHEFYHSSVESIGGHWDCDTGTEYFSFGIHLRHR